MVPSAGSSWDKEWMCREEAHRSACPCGQDSLGQAPRVREWLMGAELWGTGAYAGRLPQALEEPLGRDEELEQAAEPIPLVAGLQQPKHLAQDGGSSGFEGRVEGLEGTLHRCIQRAGILRNEGKCRWWESGPAAGGPPHRAPLPPIRCPPSHAALCRCRGSGTPTEAMLLSSGSPNPPGLETGGSGSGAEQARCRRGVRHGGSDSQRQTVLKEPGISPEAAAALLRHPGLAHLPCSGRQPCGGGGAAAAEGLSGVRPDRSWGCAGLRSSLQECSRWEEGQTSEDG